MWHEKYDKYYTNMTKIIKKSPKIIKITKNNQQHPPTNQHDTWDGKTCLDEKNLPFRNSTYFSSSWCPESPPKISKSAHYGILRKGLFRFFAYLGPFFSFLGRFGPFFGVGQIFLVSRHHGGHHRSILIFGLFHFLAIFGHFLAVFAFLGHFCIFRWF